MVSYKSKMIIRENEQVHGKNDAFFHAVCSLMPDTKESKRLSGKDPSSWGVEDVVWFIKEADPQALGPHAEAFRKHVSSDSQY